MHDQNRMPFIGAFESTYLPAHDVDVLETSGHTERWLADLELMKGAGITKLRYPIRWHRIEAERGTYDWARQTWCWVTSVMRASVRSWISFTTPATRHGSEEVSRTATSAAPTWTSAWPSPSAIPG